MTAFTMSDIKNNNSGETESLWMEVNLPSFPPLEQDIETEICIIGSGIVGLTCAYLLSKAGFKIVVLERSALAGGQSARTTAHLSWALDDRFSNLEKLFGKEKAKLAALSHQEAINAIESIINEENIDCDFERINGYLFSPSTESDKVLNDEKIAVENLKLNVTYSEKTPFIKNAGPCLIFPRQGQFHLLKYLNGLIEAIVRNGGKIFTHSHVNHFEEENSKCLVKTKSGAQVTSKSLIVATCTPINDRFYIHTKQSAYRTYVIAARVPNGSIPRALYWDTIDPYHYVRLQKNSVNPNVEWLIVGGEDHKTGQDLNEQEKFSLLETWAKEHFPMIEKVVYRWSGQVFEPVDSLAFIGKNPGSKDVYIATGDSGHGMTHGMIAGLLITDLILGKQNPWSELYEPSRKNLSSANEYIHENLNAIYQYKDWLTPGELKTVEELPSDQGIILREGIHKIAVYKDKENKIHVHTAACPHLGGCVRWNKVEKSWDCPVHGSRFNGCGEVITGPAFGDLSEMKQYDKKKEKENEKDN